MINPMARFINPPMEKPRIFRPAEARDKDKKVPEMIVIFGTLPATFLQCSSGSADKTGRG